MAYKRQHPAILPLIWLLQRRVLPHVLLRCQAATLYTGVHIGFPFVRSASGLVAAHVHHRNVKDGPLRVIIYLFFALQLAHAQPVAQNKPHRQLLSCYFPHGGLLHSK